MSSSARGRRSQQRKTSRTRAIPTRRLPKGFRIAVLRGGDTKRIHGAVERILWELGVIIEDAEIAGWLIREQGCREGAGGYLRIPPDLVSRALESLPDRVRLYDRDGKLRIDTKEPIPRFAPGVNCVHILDHESGEHRPCVLDDIRRTGRLCEALPNMDVVASLGYPADVDAEVESLETVKALAAETRKPIAFTGHDEVKVAGIWAYLAETVGGWDALAERPCGLDLTGPVSPLKLGSETCRRLKMAAESNLPIVCYPALFPGMSGPITLAGAIAQSSAEALAGVVIHQLTRPGAPILSGTAILPMDMRQADLAYGSPEYVLAGLGASEYFASVGLPSWVAAGCSDSHLPDEQAAAEVGANMALAALAGTSFIHNLGYLSSGRTGSLEMLVLCDEMAAMAGKLAAGIEVSEETLAVEVIKRAAPENAYLTDSHTHDRYLTEMWMPTLFQRSDLNAWLDGDKPPVRARLRERLSQLLERAP